MTFPFLCACHTLLKQALLLLSYLLKKYIESGPVSL